MLTLLFHLSSIIFIGVRGAGSEFLVTMSAKLNFSIVVNCSVKAFSQITFGFIRPRFGLAMTFQIFWPAPYFYE